MINHLKTEASFTKFVSGLCCNGCKFFKDSKCTETDAKKHDIDKSFMIQEAMNDYFHTKNDSHQEFAENINNYYMCDKFESNGNA